MLAKVFSKPIVRLSVVILFNENILRTTPVLGREIKQRSYARWSTRKPSQVFSSEEISSGSIDTKEFYKSEYEESIEKESAKHDGKKKDANKLRLGDEQDIKKVSQKLNKMKNPDNRFQYAEQEGIEKESSKHMGKKKDSNKLRLGDQKGIKKASQKLNEMKNHDNQFQYTEQEDIEEDIEKEAPELNERTNYGNQYQEHPDYVELGENDSTFSYLMTQVGSRKMRRKNNLIMLEGKRLNEDALQAGLKPKKIFFSKKSVLAELNIPPDTKIPLFKLPYRTLELWSRLECPPGLVGFYGMPKDNDIATGDTIPVKVLCDNVRDPGNMGSIIRVAASVGCTEVILIKGCTDPWDSKVLRAASGGHFHIPIKMDLTWEEHSEFLQPSDIVFLADSNKGKANTFLPKANTFSSNLPLHLYHEANYKTSGSVVVVIGGETEGLSHNAFSLASHYNGSRVYIPLSNCMESLNSGCALSVVLFEVKRQILQGENPIKLGKLESISRDQIESHQQSEEKQESRSSG